MKKICVFLGLLLFFGGCANNLVVSEHLVINKHNWKESDAELIKKQLIRMRKYELNYPNKRDDNEEAFQFSNVYLSSTRLLLILDSSTAPETDDVIIDMLSYNFGTAFSEYHSCLIHRRQANTKGILERRIKNIEQGDCAKRFGSDEICVSQARYRDRLEAELNSINSIKKLCEYAE